VVLEEAAECGRQSTAAAAHGAVAIDAHGASVRYDDELAAHLRHGIR
jgi:hypothetical protein